MQPGKAVKFAGEKKDLQDRIDSQQPDTRPDRNRQPLERLHDLGRRIVAMAPTDVYEREGWKTHRVDRRFEVQEQENIKDVLQLMLRVEYRPTEGGHELYSVLAGWSSRTTTGTLSNEYVSLSTLDNNAEETDRLLGLVEESVTAAEQAAVPATT